VRVEDIHAERGFTLNNVSKTFKQSQKEHQKTFKFLLSIQARVNEPIR
jgi:hypothetical protein